MYHLRFSGIRKNKNRLLWKSVSLLAPYFPSDQLQVIGHRPILNVLDYQILIRTPHYLVYDARKLLTPVSPYGRTWETPAPSSSILPLSSLPTYNPPPSVKDAIIRKLAERWILILPLVVTNCQYPKLNFSYQSVLFSYYFFPRTICQLNRYFWVIVPLVEVS